VRDEYLPVNKGGALKMQISRKKRGEEIEYTKKKRPYF